MERTHQQRSALLLVALTILIDFIGFGLILPLLPFWAQRLGANPFQIGLIMTAYALAQFIFTPVLGTLSDRCGRRPVILVSLVIEAIALALTALAWTFPLLLLARFVGGLGASNIGSAQAVVSDTTPPEQRARGMGLIGAAIGVGFVVGPALGGILSHIEPGLPFWVAAGVALINALLVFILLPETRCPDAAVEGTAARRRDFLLSGWSTLWRYPVIGRLVAINLLFTLAFTSMETALPLLVQRNFGWTATQSGYIFAYVGVLIVIMQGGLIGQLVKHWREQTIFIGGLLLLALGLLLLTVSNQVSVLLVALGVLSVGDGAVTPLASTLLSFASPPDVQGEILGTAQGVGGLGRIAGPLLAGSFFAFAGPTTPFLMGGILGMLAVLLALPAMQITRRPRPETASERSGNIAVNRTETIPQTHQQ
ncbi:MAG: MFS transporter [Ktedonobacteraceae bacterium]|nr:MFS transporter [Ktedonobacteraceae bacterium]